MNNTDIKIYGKFVNELVDNKLADAKQIYDEDYVLIHPEDGESVSTGYFQNKINKDFKESITDIQSTIGDPEKDITCKSITVTTPNDADGNATGIGIYPGEDNGKSIVVGFRNVAGNAYKCTHAGVHWDTNDGGIHVWPNKRINNGIATLMVGSNAENQSKHSAGMVSDDTLSEIWADQIKVDTISTDNGHINISDIATHGYVDDKTAAIATNVSNLSESVKTRLPQYEKKISIIDITDVNIPDLLTWTETDAKNGLYTYSFSINNTNLYNNINTAIQDLERTVGIEYHPLKYNSAKLVLAYKYNSNVYLAWSVNTDVHNIFEWVVFYSSAEGSVKTGSIELQLGGDGSTINGVAKYTATKIIDSYTKAEIDSKLDNAKSSSYTKAEIDSKLDNAKSSNDIVATIKATRHRGLIDPTTMQPGDPVIMITDADGLYDKMVLGSKVAINYSDLIDVGQNSDLVLYIGKKNVTSIEAVNQQQTSRVTTYTASFDDGDEKYILTVDSTGSNALFIK